MGSRKTRRREPEKVEKARGRREAEGEAERGHRREEMREGEGREDWRERVGGETEPGFGAVREWISMAAEEVAEVEVVATARRREKGESGERKRRESMDLDWGMRWKVVVSMGLDILEVETWKLGEWGFRRGFMITERVQGTTLLGAAEGESLDEHTIFLSEPTFQSHSKLKACYFFFNHISVKAQAQTILNPSD